VLVFVGFCDAVFALFFVYFVLVCVVFGGLV